MARLPLVLTIAWALPANVAAAAPVDPPPVAEDLQARRSVGGVLTTVGWAGVAVGTGFLIADTRHRPAFADPDDLSVPPRGPVFLAVGATSLVLGLSLALPPDVDGRGIALVPAGSGVLLLGRF